MIQKKTRDNNTPDYEEKGGRKRITNDALRVRYPYLRNTPKGRIGG